MLIRELQALCLDVDLIKTGRPLELPEPESESAESAEPTLESVLPEVL